MAMTTIPLRAEPAQALSIVLGGRDVTLRLYAREYADGQKLYCDCMVAGAWVWLGRLCHNGHGLKRYAYLPFAGDLAFVDMREEADPQWQGLGSRWLLLWGTDEDWTALRSDTAADRAEGTA